MLILQSFFFFPQQTPFHILFLCVFMFVLFPTLFQQFSILNNWFQKFGRQRLRFAERAQHSVPRRRPRRRPFKDSRQNKTNSWFGDQPFVRVFCPFWAKSTGKMGKNPENNLDFSRFFKVFQAQILRKYPRRPCGSIWSGLELRRPKFDRFRLIFPIFLLKKCVFLQFFRFFATRMASWRPRTLPKRKISNFSSTPWS